jgi:D-alanyl-lipoteichoic acid acyltransferase DltB (MBOAT superfamily)
MLFNSYEFAIFFAMLFPCYWLLRRLPRAQNLLLLGASYYFYACWNPRFLALMVLTTVVDYLFALLIDRARDERWRLSAVACSMAVNLALLGYFKYANFFADTVHGALAGLGIAIPHHHLEVALPIGISFYTFQSMSYVIDVYRRRIEPTRNLIRFALFVSFFPHLVAGPVVRPGALLPQVASRRRFDLTQFYEGAYLIFWGLVKKVAVADSLAPVVNELFGRWHTLDGGTALLAVYAFAFQIYGDFSGYTDIARGTANCLGFELPLNFNLPYFATSPQDFWNRWHITLSHWLRDYLYVPLGGSRRGRLSTYRNLMLTMLLAGLWHGAGWTFVIWGGYHGLLLVLHRAAKPWLGQIRPVTAVGEVCWTALRMVVTFHLVCLGWLIFRSASIEQAAAMLTAIVDRPALPAARYLLPAAATMIPLGLVQFFQHRAHDLNVIARTPWYVRSLFYTACFYAIVIGGEFGGQQFIYFQF